MKEWQFNVLFFVGVGSALAVLLGPELGLELGDNPLSPMGVGAILAYVLSRKDRIVKHDDEKQGKHEKRKEANDGESR